MMLPPKPTQLSWKAFVRQHYFEMDPHKPSLLDWVKAYPIDSREEDFDGYNLMTALGEMARTSKNHPFYYFTFKGLVDLGFALSDSKGRLLFEGTWPLLHEASSHTLKQEIIEYVVDRRGTWTGCDLDDGVFLDELIHRVMYPYIDEAITEEGLITWECFSPTDRKRLDVYFQYLSEQKKLKQATQTQPFGVFTLQWYQPDELKSFFQSHQAFMRSWFERCAQAGANINHCNVHGTPIFIIPLTIHDEQTLQLMHEFGANLWPESYEDILTELTEVHWPDYKDWVKAQVEHQTLSELTQSYDLPSSSLKKPHL